MDAAAQAQLSIKRQAEEAGAQFDDLNGWADKARRKDAELTAAEQAVSRPRCSSLCFRSNLYVLAARQQE